jgi:hypothetical protein
LKGNITVDTHGLLPEDISIHKDGHLKANINKSTHGFLTENIAVDKHGHLTENHNQQTRATDMSRLPHCHSELRYQAMVSRRVRKIVPFASRSLQYVLILPIPYDVVSPTEVMREVMFYNHNV